MKIRVKFNKTGDLIYIGHLDVMRYFQKMNRRAGLDLKYSQGFNPHQQMAFAQPLGVGIVSESEYVDIELNSISGTEAELVEKMNAVSVPEIRIIGARILPDGAKNAMASVAAALYSIDLKPNFFPTNLKSSDLSVEKFLAQDLICIEKETKTGTKEIDIKPFIYQMEEASAKEGGFFPVVALLDASSANNLKPYTLLQAFYRFYGYVIDDEMLTRAIKVQRIDLFERNEKNALTSMGELGEKF